LHSCKMRSLIKIYRCGRAGARNGRHDCAFAMVDQREKCGAIAAPGAADSLFNVITSSQAQHYAALPWLSHSHLLTNHRTSHTR
ncbi:MAG: hypothetical protein ACN4GZ_09185, partial [Acidimicrobiales bacterium]